MPPGSALPLTLDPSVKDAGASIGTVVSYGAIVGEDWMSALGAGQDAGELLDAQLAALLASSSGPVDWRSISSREAGEAWAAMREWVDWFRRRFVFDHRVVPPCWYLHSALVDLLSALRDHWACAYDSSNSPAGASEWHRALIQLEPRLREWASRTGCTVGAHRPDVVAEYPDDQVTWAEHVAGDVAARGSVGSEHDEAPGDRLE